MYPATYYETFMRYEASDEVFVAMPFTTAFEAAFDSVISPAIARVTVRGNHLRARVINRGTSGAPDIHERIFDAILHSRLVIADMTVQASCSTGGGTRWQANANVAYEVGLASAWRNPEDILLIHQPHDSHSYSFDIQNLRHYEYRTDDPACVMGLASEIVAALNQSRFLAQSAYQRVLETASPSTVQFMHLEAKRAFPVVSFSGSEMPIMDARIHAVTELQAARALKNRHVFRQGEGKGVAIVYQWTELGIRMLESLHAVTHERRIELESQIASVPEGEIPPQRLLQFPQPDTETIDMVEATEMDKSGDAEQQGGSA